MSLSDIGFFKTLMTEITPTDYTLSLAISKKLVIGLLLLTGCREEREIIGDAIIKEALQEVPKPVRLEVRQKIDRRIKGEEPPEVKAQKVKKGLEYIDEILGFLSTQGLTITSEIYLLLKDAAKEAGVKVIDDQPLPEFDFDKYGMVGFQLERLIMITPDLSIPGKAILLAHELSHFLRKDTMDYKKYGTDPVYHDMKEKEAWLFAGMLLWSANSLVNLMKRQGLDK